nr:Imm26 family immunity protein [uncultured Pseudomonas sp.]
MRWKTGKVFRIKLVTGAHAYALALKDPELAFFNCFNPDATLEEILSSGVLWRIWVMRQALKEPTWELLCEIKKIPEPLQQEVTRFKKDPITGKYSLYIHDQETPASKEQCIGLERAAVWSSNHISDRLNDHLAGAENIWDVSLRA